MGQTQIEHMILEAIEEIAPDVVAGYKSKSVLNNGAGSLYCKELLLQELMDARGPGALLELSESFQQKKLLSPLIYILLNSPNPESMIKKMVSYERYFSPSTCRLVIHESGVNYLVAEKVAAPEEAPLIAAELFFCGTIEAMLKLLGCEGVKVVWESVRSEQLQKVLKSLDVTPAVVAENTRWRFYWDSYERSEQILGLDEFLTSNAQPFIINSNVSVTHRVEEVLTKCLTFRPTMKEVADKLGMSVRTFQRKLHEEGITYSKIYNNLRIKKASRLLRQTNISITEIGFICGYSDSAHFSREFKKVQSMTPLFYRETYHLKRR